MYKAMAQASLAPEHRAAVLNTIGQEVRFLPLEHQEAALDATLATAATLPPPLYSSVLASLAPFVQNSTPTAHLAYWRLLSVADEMDAAHRGPALTALVAVLDFVPDDVRPRAFAEAFRMAGAMPRAAREGTLTALASKIHCLPPRERAAAFARLRETIAELAPTSRARPLSKLAEQLDSLSTEERATEFGRVLDLSDSMPLQAQSELTAALATRVGTVGTASDAALARLLGSIERLPQASRRDPLTVLRTHVQSWRLPEYRGPALAAVNDAIGRLDARHRPAEPAAPRVRPRFYW